MTPHPAGPGRADRQASPIPTPARIVAGGWSRGVRNPLLSGILGTLLFHGAVVLFAPDELPRTTPSSEPRQLASLEVILPDPEEPEPPEEEFVLTNPDAVSNPPDETRFFSNRDQQAAQREETEEGDRSLPAVEGEEPEPTQNIVSGETEIQVFEEEVVESPVGEDGGDGDIGALPERPIPGFDPAEDPDGLEAPVVAESEEELDEDPVIGVDLGKGEREMAEASTADEAGGERATPRPRPTLPQASLGPTGTRHGSAPRVGQVAVDANFSEFGDYLARMLEVIVRQWHVLAWDSLQASEVGTVVAVSFRIDSTGKVHDVAVGHSTASLIATLICQDAISARQPYGEWTSDMKQVLGEEQTVRIRFLYR